jgi:hypothetical protein
MRTASQISTAALMGFIVLVAIELALFQGVLFIVLIPPMTMCVLAINLGLLFLMVRPALFESRIIGILLGGVSACFATVLAIVMAINIHDRLMNLLTSWASTLPNIEGLTAWILRSVAANLVVVYFSLLDVLGVAMIWAGGWLQHRWYCRRARQRVPATSASPPLDERAATPL